MLFNRDRALDYMRRCNLDALVATSPVNITYFSGYYSWLGDQFKEYMVKPGGSGDLLPSFALFPGQGDPALVIDAILASNAMDVWVRDLRLFGGDSFDHTPPSQALTDRQQEIFELMAATPYAPTAVDALASLLKDKNLATARIGIEWQDLPLTLRTAIEAALPAAQFKDCSNLIRLIRMVKSTEELKLLTQAAAISEEAAALSLAQAQPGRSMLELADHFRITLAARGADLDHFAFSPKGLGIGTEMDYHLTADDALYVDYGCVYKYCGSDSGLTLALSPLSDDLAHKYDALRQCIEAGQQAMRPGAKASSVPEAMWEVLRHHGISASFPHGHGVGLEVRDYPILVADTGLRVQDDCVDEPADLPIEKDMMLNLEAMIFIPGTASLHIEQSFVVGDDGGTLLTPQERQHPFYPGESS